MSREINQENINKKNTKYEVLAPAGSYSCMVAAFNAGADAVYLGGNLFGARASANNFDKEELLNAIEYAHSRGKKLFLTVNTLLKNTQLKSQLFDYIKPLYEAGLDAVIVQDFGVMEFIKEHFPDMDIHASTQMTVTGADFARKLKECGVTRIVPARELSYSEIKAIYDATHLEIECFVHGALCYCYSGMCLLSSIIGGRSGNRGRCAQPCRLPYDVIFSDNSYASNTDNKDNKIIRGSYPLSPADLCTLDIIPDILESGVYSLKIEGRMKKPEYVAIVSAMYRKYVDMYEKYGRKGYKVDENDIRMLKDIYNRGEFTDGYYKRHNGSEIMSVTRPNHTGTKAALILEYNKKRQEITAKACEKLNTSDVLEIFLPHSTDVISVKSVNADKGAVFTTRVSGDTGYLEKICLNKKTDKHNSDKYTNKNASDRYIMRTRNNMLISELERKYVSATAASTLENETKKLSIGGAVVICQNMPVTIDVWYEDIHAHLEGSVPQPASNRPITAEDVAKQIKKTGSTIFEFADNDLTISVEDGLFINIKELNQLRRDVLEELEAKIKQQENTGNNSSSDEDSNNDCLDIKSEKRVVLNDDTRCIKPTSCYDKPDSMMISAYVSTREQFDVAVNADNVTMIAFEADIPVKFWNEFIETAHTNHKEIYLSLPYVFREHGKNFMERQMDFLKDNQLDGYVFRNMEEISWFDRHLLDRKKTVLDNTIYGFNDKAISFLNQYNPYLITASYELNMKELNHLNSERLEICVYGSIPVMFSAGCVKKTYGRCDGKEGITIIRDRFGNNFKCKNQCIFCYNIIYNSKPLKLTDVADELNDSFISRKYLFTTESAKETARVLSGQLDIDFTRGHFKRGVE